MRLASKVLGERVLFVNAAGCFTLLALFPYTPFRGSWLYTTMGSAPAGAQGVRDALDILLATGRLQPEDDVQVVVVAGNLLYGACVHLRRAALQQQGVALPAAAFPLAPLERAELDRQLG